MSLLLDEKFIRQISSMLDRFSAKGNGLYNFRCPFCGDSDKSKRKARGYFIPGKAREGYFFKCHNCNEAIGSFKNFLKVQQPAVYREYELEHFMETHEIKPSKKVSAATHFISSATKELTPHIEPVPASAIEKYSERLTDLPKSHFARQYVINRKIPSDFHQGLFYTPAYKEFVNQAFPEDTHKMPSDKRLIIPFYDAMGFLQGVSGRALEDDGSDWPKYIITRARTTPDFAKLYGLERLDWKKRIYIVEGPIDAMFLPNCVALQDSALFKTKEMFIGSSPLSSRAHTFTIVPDNQPRNKESNASLLKAIKEGLDVVIWPKFIQEKDINDMILAGMTQFEIMANIDDHTYNGLRAEFEYNRWRKD
jgi:hypothetical protein